MFRHGLEFLLHLALWVSRRRSHYQHQGGRRDACPEFYHHALSPLLNNRAQTRRSAPRRNACIIPRGGIRKRWLGGAMRFQRWIEKQPDEFESKDRSAIL